VRLSSGEHATATVTAAIFVEILADRYPLERASRSAAIAWPSGDAASSIAYATSTTSEPPAIRRHPAIRSRNERNGIHSAQVPPLWPFRQSTRCADASAQKQARTAKGRRVSLVGARRLSYIWREPQALEKSAERALVRLSTLRPLSALPAFSLPVPARGAVCVDGQRRLGAMRARTTGTRHRTQRAHAGSAFQPCRTTRRPSLLAT
jgi:hypothetical protein